MASATDITEIAGKIHANLRSIAGQDPGRMVFRRKRDYRYHMFRDSGGLYSKRAIDAAITTLGGIRERLRIDTSDRARVYAVYHPVLTIPCAICAQDVPIYLTGVCPGHRRVALCNTSCRKAFGTLATLNGWYRIDVVTGIRPYLAFSDTNYSTPDGVLVVARESMIAWRENWAPFDPARSERTGRSNDELWSGFYIPGFPT